MKAVVQRRYGSADPFVSQKLVPLMSAERGEVYDELRVMIEAGTVKPALDRTFPLSEALNAIEHVYSRRSAGEVVVTI
ncbi:zinc-binding dehydrogenase [Lentzea sp. NPDC004782]|uniref:zinc-binding dehydrogenase n=1 Tax=Lentzea sp. NPDC004782 TaxID=3154458 RepID=UPI0033A8CC1A